MISRRSFTSGIGAFGLLTGCGRKGSENAGLTTVRFGMLPYGDHTQSIIGVNKGWFKDVGIDLQYNVIKIEEVVAFLAGNRYDVISTPPGVLLAGYNQSPGLVMVTFNDLFQGFALIGQLNEGLRTFSEIVANGTAPEEAIKQAVMQIKGKRFAYPPEGGVRPFIDLLLESGGLSSSDFTPIVVDDPIGVAAMLRHDADFHVGGVPARLTLQKAGCKVIVSAADFARLAKPSSDSKALRAVLPGGWAMRRAFYEQNRDLVRKLYSISFRINDFIRSNFDEAAEIHMTYLSKVTGQSYGAADAKIIYDDLDPFWTFDQQARWFEDKSFPLYFEHLMGAQIKSFVANNSFSGKPPTVAELVVANEVYTDLKREKEACERRYGSEVGSRTEYQARNYLACAV